MQDLIKYDKYYNLKKNTNNWRGITLTDSAVKHILQLINDDTNHNMLGLKITIKKSGCAGFSYNINKAFSLEKECITYERNGAKLFIPFTSMPFIDGSELDYVQTGLSYSFKFKNPTIQYSCGCGESFGI